MVKAPSRQSRKLPGIALWVSLVGCAISAVKLSPLSAAPSTFPPSKLAGDRFDDMTCERLKSERAKRFVIWNGLAHPPLFASNTQAERQQKLTEVRGEIKAIEKVQVDKKCPGAGGDWSSHMDF
jgi:hypothetical protein